MFSMRKNIVDHNQIHLIKGYNLLIKTYNQLFPDNSWGFSEMNVEGICSGDTTKWLESKFSFKKNNNVYLTYIRNRAALAQLASKTPSEIENKLRNNYDEMVRLAVYGDYLVKLHNGSEYTANIEKKQFRKDMRAIWLHTLPLIVKKEIKREMLKEQLALRVDGFRFLSEYHVISAYIENDQIEIHDPNDSDGDKIFKLSELDNILSYLEKRFSVIKQSFEAISVFVSVETKHPEINPLLFQDLNNYINGMGRTDSLTLLIDDEKISSQIRSNEQNAVGKLKKLIENFNHYAAVIDDNFISQIIEHLRTIKSIIIDQNIISRIDYFIRCLSKINQEIKYKTNKDIIEHESAVVSHVVSIDYLIKSIIRITINLLENETHQKKLSDQHQDLLKQILIFENIFLSGSNSLDYIVYTIKKYLSQILSSNDKELVEKLAWHLLQLENFHMSPLIKNKTKWLKPIAENGLVETNQRFDLLLISVNQINLDKFKKIVMQNNNSPILISVGNSVFIFGRTSIHSWNIVKLNNKVFEDFIFPIKLDTPVILNASRISENIIEEINLNVGHILIRQRNNLDVAINMSSSHAVAIFAQETGEHRGSKYHINGLVPFSDQTLKYLTPLESAVRVNNAEIIRVLCINGANANVINSKNQTILHHGNIFINPDIINILLNFSNISSETLYYQPSTKQKNFIELLQFRLRNLRSIDNNEVDKKIKYQSVLIIADHLLKSQTTKIEFLKKFDESFFFNYLLQIGGHSQTIELYIKWKMSFNSQWILEEFDGLIKLTLSSKDIETIATVCNFLSESALSSFIVNIHRLVSDKILANQLHDCLNVIINKKNKGPRPQIF